MSHHRMLPSPLSPDHTCNNKRQPIFVFGSDLSGQHRSGTAQAAAVFHGAEKGKTFGPTGNAFAIPTKNFSGRGLALETIKSHIREFSGYARERKDIAFQVPRIGCGQAGWSHREREIAETFIANDPGNLHLPGTWERWRPNSTLRICIVNSTPHVRDDDIALMRLMLRRHTESDNTEIVAAGYPLEPKLAIETGKLLGLPVRLIASYAMNSKNSSTALLETLAWYSATAIIVHPAAAQTVDEQEQRQCKRLALFERLAVYGKLGHRSITTTPRNEPVDL